MACPYHVSTQTQFPQIAVAQTCGFRVCGPSYDQPQTSRAEVCANRSLLAFNFAFSLTGGRPGLLRTDVPGLCDYACLWMCEELFCVPKGIRLLLVSVLFVAPWCVNVFQGGGSNAVGSSEADRTARSSGESSAELLGELVAHLRANRAQLRKEWARRSCSRP